MKRFLVTLTAVALAGSTLQAAGTDPNLDYNVLQGRIASMESKVKTLEKALNELSARVAEPSPTKTSAPVVQQTPAPTPPAPPVTPAPDAEPAKAPVAPAKTPEVEKYVIGENDTISEISRKLNIPRAELMEANNLREGQQIYIGDELIIPQPKKAEPAIVKADEPQTPEKPKPSPAKPATPSAPAATYTVKLGDTLTKIAREHGVSVADLKLANNMKSDFINGGQKLKIPSKNGGGSNSSGSVAATEEVNQLLKAEETYGVYTVLKGDTLYSLARDFFTSEKEIQRLNKLGSATSIRPGQDLVVPTSKYAQHHDLANNG